MKADLALLMSPLIPSDDIVLEGKNAMKNCFDSEVYEDNLKSFSMVLYFEFHTTYSFLNFFLSLFPNTFLLYFERARSFQYDSDHHYLLRLVLLFQDYIAEGFL